MRAKVLQTDRLICIDPGCMIVVTNELIQLRMSVAGAAGGGNRSHTYTFFYSCSFNVIGTPSQP